MDVKQAVFYPYRKGNFLRSVGVPTGLMLLASALMGAAMFGVIFTSLGVEQLAGLQNDPMALLGVLGPALGLGCIVMLPFALLMNGYFWNLVATWQTDGLDAPPPAWKGQFGAYMVDGFHSILSMLVLTVPMILGYLTLGFLLPFALAPYMEAAQERRVGAVLRRFGPSMAQATRQYLPILGGMWMCVLLYIPVYLVMVLSGVTVVGPLFVSMAYSVTCMALLTQQYGASGSPQYRSRPNKPMPSVDEPFAMAGGASMGYTGSTQFGASSASAQPDPASDFSMEPVDDLPEAASDDTVDLLYKPAASSDTSDSGEASLNDRWMADASVSEEPLPEAKPAKGKAKGEKAPPAEKKSKSHMKMLKLQPGDNPWLRNQNRV